MNNVARAARKLRSRFDVRKQQRYCDAGGPGCCGDGSGDSLPLVATLLVAAPVSDETVRFSPLVTEPPPTPAERLTLAQPPHATSATKTRAVRMCWLCALPVPLLARSSMKVVR